MRKIFLACPYGHDDNDVVEKRFQIANAVSAQMIRSGAVVFSQVSMSHPINACMKDLDRASIGATWAPVDAAFMEMMNELVILDIEGWDKSAGIKREIAFFESRDRKISLWSEIKNEFK